ncbi:MAG: NAD-dependent epimerase/dehydratase family protein [Candidatus Kapaibacterium sp.]
MHKKTILITGANGEIGHTLLEELTRQGHSVVAIDLNPMSSEHQALCEEVIVGNILDEDVIRSAEKYDVDEIYHLAALLSTSAERNPEQGHKVNVEGTLNFLQLAYRMGKRTGNQVKFLFPSTIAVYGIPSLADKLEIGKVTEEDCLMPMTMYGVNKLYNEHLGRYYSELYKRLSTHQETGFVDFRGVRFPGLISAFTVPTGGTSDFAPEMIHKAAQNLPYDCFVRADAQIPFMAMPDGVRALMELAAAPSENLTRRIYNIGAYAPTALEFSQLVKAAFPSAVISFKPDEKRQGIIDSWPSDVDDSAARHDWGWKPEYDLKRTFDEYLLPNIMKRYA